MGPCSIGTVIVYPFGVILAAAAVPALVWTGIRMRKAGLKKETLSWFALLAVPLAFLTARLSYCLLVMDRILGDQDWGMIFRVREGGFLLWGALAGGLLAAWITGRITRQSAGAVADAAVLPVCLLIVLGRLTVGLLFQDQGIGLDLESWFDPEETDAAARYSLLALQNFAFFERFPFAVQNYYEEWCWAIFVPESIWAGVIMLLVSRVQSRPGGRTALFLILYSCGQIVLEAMLRGDVIHLPWLGFVRANQVLCALAVLILWGVCLRGIPKGQRKRPGGPAMIQVLLAAGIVVAMEFAAFEKKISALEIVPADVCHLIMALACIWMALALRPLWRKKFGPGEPETQA